MTLDALIDLLGGDAAVARICGCGQPAVSNWRKRGLPPRRMIQLARAAERKGVPLCLKDFPVMSPTRTRD
jgi:hypothetical protein